MVDLVVWLSRSAIWIAWVISTDDHVHVRDVAEAMVVKSYASVRPSVKTTATCQKRRLTSARVRVVRASWNDFGNGIAVRYAPLAGDTLEETSVEVDAGLVEGPWCSVVVRPKDRWSRTA